MQEELNGTKPQGSMYVAELAAQSGVTPATVRHYSRSGLLTPDRDRVNGYRCFSWADLQRIRFVRRAQALGLKLTEIKKLLQTIDQGKKPYNEIQVLVRDRLTELEHQIADLNATRERIQQALEAWQYSVDLTPTEEELCPLIERLNFFPVDSAST